MRGHAGNATASKAALHAVWSGLIPCPAVFGYLGGRPARSWTYERDPRGAVGLLADRDRGVLVGAWAVAPLAGDWTAARTRLLARRR